MNDVLKPNTLSSTIRTLQLISATTTDGARFATPTSIPPSVQALQNSGRVAPPQEVDHIIPLEQGGTHDETNLQALCKPCHSAKTAREDGRWDRRSIVYSY